MLLKTILEILLPFSCHSNPVTNKQRKSAVISQFEDIQILVRMKMDAYVQQCHHTVDFYYSWKSTSLEL